MLLWFQDCFFQIFQIPFLKESLYQILFLNYRTCSLILFSSIFLKLLMKTPPLAT